MAKLSVRRAAHVMRALGARQGAKALAAELAKRQCWQRDNEELRAKYTAMLAKVKAWEPPSADHVGMQRFMIEQIQESISFDCYEVSLPVRCDPHEWHAERLNGARLALAQAVQSQKEDLERHEGRKRWIEQLYASLEEQ